MPRARDLVVHSLGWKLAAVATAYFLWLVVIEEPQVVRQLEVPVRFEHLGPDLALVRDRPSTVIVRVQATEPVAKELQPHDVEAVIDLTGRGVGTHLVRLAPDSPALSPRRPGISVTEVFPPLLEVKLEPRRTAEVTVQPRLVGAPPPGFEVASVELEPRRVRIEGPESAVRRTTEAYTREVVIEGKTGPIQQETVIEVANPDVIIVSSARTRVTVHVEEKGQERTFADVPVVAIGGPDAVRLTPRLARVSLAGPARLVAELRREDVVAFVQLDGVTPERGDLQVPVSVTFTREQFRDKLRVRTVPEAVAVRLPPRRSRGG